MTNHKKMVIKLSVAVLAIATPLIYAYEYGPDPGYTGAPGDNKTGCEASGCHSGKLNPTTGSAVITASGGTTYTPGQTQTISVKITDSTEKKYGFQLTARLDSSATAAAGTFTKGTDGFTQVLCTDGSDAPVTGCTAKSGGPLQWVEHTLDGYKAKTNASPTFTYSFTWTAPSTNVGPITLYAAGNAVLGTLSSLGANTYTTKLTLTPGAAPTGPAVTAVVPHSSSATSIQPGSFVDIYGSNLAPSLVTWNNDFPTTLGGVTVTINNKPAYLLYVSPTVISAQAPDDTATGSASLVVTSGGVASSPAPVTLSGVAPALFLFDAKYPAAVIPVTPGFYGNYDLLGPAGRFSFNSRAVKKGEPLLLYTTGFGATTPPVAAGKAITDGLLHPANLQATVSIGGVTQTVTAYEIFSGEYQLNVTIPQNVGSGDQPLVVTVGGLQTQANIFIPVQ